MKNVIQPKKDTQKVTAKGMKPPYKDNAGPSTRYFLSFIDESTAKLIDCECTSGVYEKALTQKVTHKFREDFIMFTKPGTAIIERLDIIPKADYYNSMFGEPVDDISAAGSTIPVVIISKFPDGSLDVRAKPANTPATVITEILDYLKENNVKTYDFIANKYLVVDTRQEGAFIHVDPTPR